MSRPFLAALMLSVLAPGMAGAAGCRIATEGTRCLTVTPRTAPLAQGDALPETARLVMNPRYWGLPAVEDGQRYYVLGREVYRVDAASMQVIDRVFGANPGIFR
ncbi:MAG: hypothetical protein MUE98_07910 [Rhodobacteraceae bacterium]|nr:hypothetical protein [Paracoccaceae bacterium]